MKLVRDIASFSTTQKTIVTIGNFDAMHQGHQQLIQTLVTIGQSQQLAPTLITFEPLPPEVFSTTPPARLCSFKEKFLHLKKWALDYVICLRFNKQLASCSATDFVKQVLVDKLNVKHLLVGSDFRFGYQRQGDITLLQTLGKTWGFHVAPFQPCLHQQTRISSTAIRRYLTEGQLDLASTLLNRPFSLSGRVSYGHQRGRQWGFPTANIHLRRKAVPLQGVYLVKAQGIHHDPLLGVANIGHRPTVDGLKKPLLEVHLLDFSGSIYGKYLTITFLKKIRDEQRFDSFDALKKQIALDVAAARRFFSVTATEK